MPSADFEKALLVALRHGLPPHAEPLVCDDVHGERSLFGAFLPLPRPLKHWQPGPHEALKTLTRAALYEESSVLWEGKGLASAAERAGRIASQGRTDGLDMPASAFIAGNSASSFPLAWTLLEDGLLPEWGSVLCSCQLRGKGQLGRHWHSPRGNLHVSFRLPRDPLLSGDAASVLTGYILAAAFRALGFPIFLKWPNDLLLQERAKVGGILLEERQGVLMAGLGVNLAEAPADADLRERRAVGAAVLLPEHGVPAPDGIPLPGRPGGQGALAPFVLWRRLVSEALLVYIRHVQGRSMPEVLAAIERLLAWKGRAVALMDGDEDSLTGHCVGLGPGGGLLLQLSHGERREFFSGSLSLV